MNWLTKLERKFGRYYIPNLISILVGGQIVVYAVELFVNRYITYSLTLTRPALFAGEIWRLVTFLFVPSSSGSILNFALGAYFVWFLGSALEAAWGDFRFNVYVLAEMLGAVLACLVTGWAGTYCLSLSLLLAFALLYPEMQVLLFFLIPIKVKYFGIFSAAVWVLGFLSADWMTRLNYLLSMAGFILFFAPSLCSSIRAWYRREQWRRRNRR